MHLRPGWQIYHPKKKTGSKSTWARVPTVSFNPLSLRSSHRIVFAGLHVVAKGNSLYQFGTQMWAIGHKRQRHFATLVLRPLPQRPVLELPEDNEANHQDEARGF
ncbi:hypothetical protein FN846DRAFT_904016 [Sphaerosporella brunnea]|uniref:Uncharacterized protein n=1 Tax=Sphaerosporella brunnea TaxID=1250544 RepID=A0A5J5F5R1_9PEZI|nr:hypothetical protein FN846DRAFT_904016 [Sphaerosporella brunnea]